MQSRTLFALPGALSVLLLSSWAVAQDVDVPNNLTMRNSTDSTVGNVLKEGVPFIHNFGTNNTFLGVNAGNLTMTGGGNTASGVSALFFNTTGAYNTASGVSALASNTTGFSNTASGVSALASNTTGFSNTASGVNALQRNTTGDSNTASGVNALLYNTTGAYNTASGAGALYNNTTGDSNTASGVNALLYNTTGSQNTASGVNALRNNSTGYSNTASGNSALRFNTTGSYNTAIGVNANVSVGYLVNATAIGAEALVDASNKIRLGDAQVTVIEGEVGFTASSDRNKKENLKAVDGEEVLGKIRGLNLTSWNFIGHDPKQFRHYGPMAQDFFTAFGDDGIGKIGTPTTITSTDLDGILMVAAQALEKRTEALKAENAELKARLETENADLRARLEALERRVGTHALTAAQ
jgi:hypothetical protein